MEKSFDLEIETPDFCCFVSGFYDAEPVPVQHLGPQQVRFLQTNEELISIREVEFFSGIAPLSQVQKLAVENLNEKIIASSEYWDII